MNELVPFNDLLINVVDNRGKTAPTAAQGIPLIATNCIKLNSMYPVFEKVRYVSEETYQTWFRDHPKPGDILFVTKGSPGRTSLVPDPVNFSIAQDMVAVRANPERIYPKFLFALLRSESTLAAIDGLHVGTMIPHFKKGDFGRLLLPIPNRSKQELIGDTYFELSEKIELNRQMNQTLDEIARTLFRSWFVAFDPVRAKAEDRQPEGMDAETAALFPDRFVESELGPIPEGWEVGRLDDFLLLQRGFDLPTASRSEGVFPVISAGGPSGTHSEFKVQGPGVVTGRSGVIGKVFYSSSNFWPLNTSLWVKEFRHSRPLFAFYLLQTLNLYSYRTGSAVPTLNRNHVHALKIARPPISTIVAFEGLAGPIHELIEINLRQSLTLAEVRDTLLPELLSGRLSAPLEVDSAKEVG